jgi:hypothetical protein
MIERVTLRNFKMFQEETFDLSDSSILLAGPNNTGKSTLLQAVAVWNLALRKWIAERGPATGSRARQRTGVALTRKEFTAIPLREMNLLWTNRSTALYKTELSDHQKLGTPRPLEIGVRGTSGSGEWEVTLEFTYRYPDLVHVRPAEETPRDAILEEATQLQVVHVPPFSGIGSEETHYDRPYQDWLIGQGKSGDILRNLLLEVRRERPGDWDALHKDIEEIFGYHLLPPIYDGQPFIVCEYQPGDPSIHTQRPLPKLDISCAGSGLLQVLMLLGFFYARPAAVLLLDEPDAHLHVILQKQVYDRLRSVARRRECQLLIATHSEVLIDGTSPERILSLLDHPHRLLTGTHRDQVREALKRLTSLDLLLAEQSGAVLYLEGETDLNLLREWARVLEHPVHQFLVENPFWHSNQGRNPAEARAHFFALKAVNPSILGVLLLDGDNRQLADHEGSAERLTTLRWKRYESENYLVHAEALVRFVEQTQAPLFGLASAESGRKYLEDQLPPAVYRNPLADHDYLDVTPASKTLLPGFFEAAGVSLSKNEYYQVAAQMTPEEIAPEVKRKLDQIHEMLSLRDGRLEGES